MKAVRSFYIKIIVFLFIGILISSIWQIARPWKIYVWIILAAALLPAIVPIIGAPFYNLYTKYAEKTTEGMRFFQGMGLVLLLIGFYRLWHVALASDPLAHEIFLRNVCQRWNWSMIPPGDFRIWILIGSLLMISGLIRPIANALFAAWMKFAGLLQIVMSRVVLTLVYILAVLPVGLTARLVGKKFMDKSFKSEERDSYWLDKDYEYNPDHYRRHF